MSHVPWPTTAKDASNSRSACTRTDFESVLPQGGWEVVLLVDNMELARSKERASFLESLSEGIRCELRSLPVGDYMWVARSGDFEIILDWVFERKTTVNLAISLGTKAKKHPPLNQMQVQLLNMKFSGIRNKVLLVEKSYCWRKHHYRMSSVFLKDLRREQPDMIVQHTHNLEATIEVLITKHRDIDAHTLVRGRFREAPERPYLTFAQIRRNLKDGFDCDAFRWEMDLRQNRCLGPKKAKAVMTVFPTRSSLREAFQSDKKGTIQRLADLKSFSTKTSKEVCDAFAARGCESDTEPDSNLARAPAVDAESVAAAAPAAAATHQTLRSTPLLIELLDSSDESEDGKLPVISPGSCSSRGSASRKRKLGRRMSLRQEETLLHVDAESVVAAAPAAAATHQTLRSNPLMIELLDSSDASEDGKLPVISPDSCSSRGLASRKRKLGRSMSPSPGRNTSSQQEANASASRAIETLSDSSG